MTRPRYAALLSAALLWLASPALQAQTEVEDADTTARKAPEPTGPELSSTMDPGEFAPTIQGLTGLFRTVTTHIGGANTFRIGLHTEAFKSSGFLVEGDDNTRFIGTLAASYTPWRYLEFFANFRSSANSNDRPTEANRRDDPVILALGDIAFGGKGQYPVTPWLGLGLNLAVSLMNSVGGVSFDGDSTGFYIGAISSLDFTSFHAPVEVHLNLGYQLDNSNNLAGGYSGYGLASLQVEKFALGINPSRLQIRLAMDFPLRKYTGFGLTPILEFATDVATGDPDPDFDNPTMRNAIRGMLQSRLGHTPTEDDINAEIDPKATIWGTIGVRATPVKGFNVELATDIGMVSPGYGFGPPVVPWNIVFGLSYAYDPAPPTRVVMKETVKTVVKEVGAQPKLGKLRGRVINTKTLEPVEGAIVTLPGKDLTGLSTDPDGTFLTYELPPGKHNVVVRHPDYQPAKLQLDVKLGAVSSQDVKLEPAAPKIVRLGGRVADQAGKPVAASLAASGPENKQVTAGADGSYSLELKPGSYTISATADGYLRKEQLVAVAPGAALTADFTLSIKPKRPLVRVDRKEIVITRQIHFATNGATILPDSSQLLDSIVDVLVGNPNIKRVEIGGHTDNRGKPEANQQLSQARADAVKDYLIRNGISPDRLDAKGYGPAKPKVPNITPMNRAKNRRVEFLILEQ